MIFSILRSDPINFVRFATTTKIKKKYCDLTLHATLTKLIGSLHNMQKNLTQLLWTLGNYLPLKTDIFVAGLDLKPKRLKHLNTVV